MECRKLKLDVEQVTPPVISASGELDYQNCDELGALIRSALDGHGSAVRLALGDLDIVDSSGLRILITSALDAGQHGRSVDIISMTPQLSHMLEVSGFKHLFGEVRPPADRVADTPTEYPQANSPYSFEIPADVTACHEARNRVCDFAAAAGFAPLALDDIRLAVGEAISNAVRHGTCKGGPIRVECRMESDRLRITLYYPSEPFDPDGIPMPDADSPPEGGMGIYFMRLVMDGLKHDFKDGCMTVTLEKLTG